MKKTVVKSKNAFFVFILEMAHNEKEKEKEIDFEKKNISKRNIYKF